MSVFKICIIVTTNSGLVLLVLLNEENQPIEQIYDSLLANSWQQQKTNNKPIRVEYNIWGLAEAYDYVLSVFQFDPYQGVQKGKQVVSSTKWGLGENFVLWKVFADEYMNDYFTSFCQFTHLGVNNIRATIKIKRKN